MELPSDEAQIKSHGFSDALFSTLDYVKVVQEKKNRRGIGDLGG